MTTTTDKAIPAIETEVKRPDFGQGRFAFEMNRLYDATQKLFGFTEAQAEKFARQAASDAGAALKNANATLKVGKANSDGKATISDASKMKGVTLTNALLVTHAISWIDDAGKHGVSYGKTKWTLAPELQKYVDGL